MAVNSLPCSNCAMRSITLAALKVCDYQVRRHCDLCMFIISALGISRYSRCAARSRWRDTVVQVSK